MKKLIYDGTDNTMNMISGRQIRVDLKEGERLQAESLNDAFNQLLDRIEKLEDALADYGLLVYKPEENPEK